MPMLNRPLTAPEIKALIETQYRPDLSIYDIILRNERWPHMVHYNGRGATYVPPDHFLIGSTRSPSACVWIVPGTTP